MSDPTHRWNGFLDQFEAHLAAQRSMLEAEDWAAIDIMLPPTDLPPMPPEYAERMAQAIRGSLELEEAVATRMEMIARELSTVQQGPARRPADKRRSGMLDTSL